MNIQKPPRIEPKLKAAPVIKNLYWCDFPLDAQLPEFWKMRPVVVISYRNTLYGSVTVIPCSTKEQFENRWAFPLKTTIDNRIAYTICDKVTTVAVSRLLPHNDGKVRRMPQDEFNQMIAVLEEWLPKSNP